MSLLCVVPVNTIYADSNMTAIFIFITSLALSLFILSRIQFPFHLLYKRKGTACFATMFPTDTLILEKYFHRSIETEKGKHLLHQFLFLSTMMKLFPTV